MWYFKLSKAHTRQIFIDNQSITINLDSYTWLSNCRKMFAFVTAGLYFYY